MIIFWKWKTKNNLFIGMARIDWEQVGRDSKRLRHDAKQAANYAKTLNSGIDLNTSENASFAKGYVGSGVGSSGITGDKSGGSVTGKIFETIADFTKTQEVNAGNYLTENNNFSASASMQLILDANNKLIKPKEILNKLAQNTLEIGKEYYQNQTQLLHAINEGTSLTGKLSKGVREELTATNVELTKYGISFQDIVTASLNYTAQTSKFNLINTETFEKVAQSAKAYVGELGDLTNMLPNFEKIGYGASDTAKQIQISGQRMMKLGLDSKSMLKEVGGSLDKINQYGFKDGVQGLSNMVTKAKEFRMSMEETFTIANKVMDPDGAIDMAANLMAIGGAIGDLGDPLKMMYMATNNVEGIQDALIGAASSLATFNKEGGRFEVTGINLRKAKAMADAMGVSMGELTKGAIAAAERTSAATDMLSNGLKLDKDQTDLITNLSKMKDGKMIMEIQGDEMRKILGVGKEVKEVALENLTQTQATQLAEYQKRESEKTPEQIIRGQATNIENSTRDINYILRLLVNQSAKTLGKGISSIAKTLGIDPEELTESIKDFRDVAAKNITNGYDVLNDLIDKNKSDITSDKKPDAAKITGVDNSEKQRELDKAYQKGKTNEVTHIHKVETSNVVFDNVRNLWNEEFSKKDPRQYTGEYYV